MGNLEKKGNTNRRLITFMWFTLCCLSFLFFINPKAYAETNTYKYTFDLGPGTTIASPDTRNPSKSTGNIKLVLTVEEKEEKAVSDLSRYTIIDRELNGYQNFTVSWTNDMHGATTNKTVIQTLGYDLAEDNNKTIGKVCQYASLATESAESRKFMTALMACCCRDSGYFSVMENGERTLFWYDPNATGNDVTKDPYFSGFNWLNDHKWGNVDFYDYFKKRSTKGYHPFNPSFADDKVKVYIEGTPTLVSSFLTNDQNVLKLINLEIEDGTSVGTYLKSKKTLFKKDDTLVNNEEYIWWYKEGSFDKNNNKILIEVGKTQGNAEFMFCYDPEGRYSNVVNVGTLGGAQGEHDYSIIANGVNKYTQYQAMTSSIATDPLSNHLSEDADGNLSFKTDSFFLAVDTLSGASDGNKYIRVAKWNKVDTPNTFVYGDTVCSINSKDLNKIIEELGGTLNDTSGLKIKENNGYVFEFDPQTKWIHFYKKDDPSYVGMNMKLDQMYNIFYDCQGYSYGLALKADPRGKDKTNAVGIAVDVDGNPQMRLPALEAFKSVHNESLEQFSFEWNYTQRRKAMFFCATQDPDYDILLAVRSLENLPLNFRGTTEGESIDGYGCELIARISIRDWLFDLYPDEVEAAKRDVERIGTPGIGGIIISGNEMQERITPFLKTLFRYAKPIIMFLIFISLVLAALFAIIDNGDADKRVLIKERIKNILLGALFFSICVFIISIATDYYNKASESIIGEEVGLSYNIEGVYTPDDNWVLRLLNKIIDAISDVIKWFIEFVGSRLLCQDSRELDLSTVIFNVDKGGGIGLYPYTAREWENYMWGYKMLTTLSIALIAIALIKNIVMVIFNAGNSAKEAEVKQDFLRAFIAILCTILVPYAFRLVLLLVNSLVKLVPVTESKFNLNFDGYGFLGSIASISYLIVEVKVYLVFAVRKIMMSFLLMATPIVFGLWAISKKFRSFDLWLGELSTNAFMQVGYAFSFFFLVVILSNESNPFAILLLVGMLMKIADFIRDSIQGLFTQWGGINETAQAEGVYNTVVGAGKKVYGEGNTIKTNTGRFIQKGADYLDKDKVSKKNLAWYTAGGIISGDYRRALLHGDLGKIRTEKDRLNNVKSMVESERKKKQKESKDLKNEISTLNPEMDELIKAYDAGVLTKEQMNRIRTGEGANFDSLRAYIGSEEEVRKYKQTEKEVGEQIKNTTGVLSSIQATGTDKRLDEALKGAGSEAQRRAYKDVKEEYKKNEKKLNDLCSNFGSLTDEQKAKRGEEIKQTLRELSKDGLAATDMAVELNISPEDLNIESTQRLGIQTLADYNGDIDSDVYDNLEKTLNNVEKLKDAPSDKEFISKEGAEDTLGRAEAGQERRNNIRKPN
ncbi:MAG: hypothetical protein MJ245_05645 [Clostridia bacterium]|nr:hypothetical protein [Clostridia bacterium]